MKEIPAIINGNEIAAVRIRNTKNQSSGFINLTIVYQSPLNFNSISVEFKLKRIHPSEIKKNVTTIEIRSHNN